MTFLTVTSFTRKNNLIGENHLNETVIYRHTPDDDNPELMKLIKKWINLP